MQQNKLIVSCHRALIGAIPTKLRGLTVKLEDSKLYWKGYFDGEPTEEEQDAVSTACTEVLADFPFISSLEEEYVNYPYPQKMDMLQFWVFLRWEEAR